MSIIANLCLHEHFSYTYISNCNKGSVSSLKICLLNCINIYISQLAAFLSKIVFTSFCASIPIARLYIRNNFLSKLLCIVSYQVLHYSITKVQKTKSMFSPLSVEYSRVIIATFFLPSARVCTSIW